MNFLFDFQDSLIDDDSILKDFPHLSQESQSTNSNKRKATPIQSSRPSSRASSISSTSIQTSKSSELKEMAVDALRSLSNTQPKNKFSALGEYIAAELQSLTPQQAEYAKSKLSRAFNDIVDEAVAKVSIYCDCPHYVIEENS